MILYIIIALIIGFGVGIITQSDIIRSLTKELKYLQTKKPEVIYKEVLGSDASYNDLISINNKLFAVLVLSSRGATNISGDSYGITFNIPIMRGSIGTITIDREFKRLDNMPTAKMIRTLIEQFDIEQDYIDDIMNGLGIACNYMGRDAIGDEKFKLFKEVNNDTKR